MTPYRRKRKPNCWPKPLDRLAWADYYAQEFNRKQRPSAAHMAVWYLLMHHAFGSEEP